MADEKKAPTAPSKNDTTIDAPKGADADTTTTVIVEQGPEEAPVAKPVDEASLSGLYIVSHGSLEMGNGQTAKNGAKVRLSHEDAKTCLAAGTVKAC